MKTFVKYHDVHCKCKYYIFKYVYASLVINSIVCQLYISYPPQLLQPIEPPSPAKMMLLLLPLLLLLDLGHTLALTILALLEADQVLMILWLTSNAPLQLSAVLPPTLGVLFRGKKPYSRLG